MSTLVIRNLLLPGGLADLAITDGRVAAFSRHGAEEVDGTGMVAVPRLTDSHLHLDKTFLGGRWFPHRSGGGIADRIRLERESLDRPEIESTYVRAERLLQRAVANGSTRLRSHVDISAELGLSRLEALLSLREAYRDVVDLTFVAFPQEGILSSPGTAELLDEALSMGVEAVGGLDPASRDGDMERHLNVVFALAAKYDRHVDIHLHDLGEVGTSTMMEIAARTTGLGLLGKVAISHGYAFGSIGRDELVRTATALAEAEITLITNVPGSENRPPAGALTDLGMNVVFASDNVRDSWSPYGKADMLDRVALAGYLFGWNDDRRLLEGLDRVTVSPSRALGDEPALLGVGDPADFTLVAAGSLQEAIVLQPPGRIVYRKGVVVAQDGKILALPASVA